MVRVDNLNLLRPVRSQKLYSQVEEQLSNLFRSGELRPGNKLPSEKELMQRLQVSRSIIREALRILEAKGLIEGHQGKGWFVQADLNFKLDEFKGNPLMSLEKVTLLQIYESRLVIEPTLARWAAERATEKDLQFLCECLENLEYSDQSNTDDFRFHMALAKAAHNQMSAKTIQLHLETQLLYSDQLFWDIRSENPIDQWKKDHRELFEAVKRHDGQQASEIMHRHIEDAYKLLLEK